MPLSKSTQATIAEARLIAGADTRDRLISALSALRSPTMAHANPATIEQSTLHAAALGQAQAICRELANQCEILGNQLDEARADSEPWAVWWVNTETGKSHTVEHAPRQTAREMALRMNQTAGADSGFVALPLGGLPADMTDEDLAASIERGTSDLAAGCPIHHANPCAACAYDRPRDPRTAVTS